MPTNTPMPETSETLGTWRETMREAKELRRLHSQQGKKTALKSSALWMGAYALDQMARSYEKTIVASGGLLCLVAP